MAQQHMPSLDEMKKMGDTKAAPLLAKLKTDPNNADVLNQLGMMYRARTSSKPRSTTTRSHSTSIPRMSARVRTWLPACITSAMLTAQLAQLDKSLTYDPKHAGTLINIGIIRWKGKNDVDGAVAAWEKAIKLSPNPQDKEVIQHMISQAKQHQKSAPSITGVTG